jgi:hypothetical protein
MANFKRTITVDVSEEELSSIIRKHFKLPASAKVSFNVREVSDYMDRHSHHAFGGATVTYTEDVSDTGSYQGPG